MKFLTTSGAGEQCFDDWALLLFIFCALKELGAHACHKHGGDMIHTMQRVKSIDSWGGNEL